MTPNGSGLMGVRKNVKLLKYEHIIYGLKARDLEIPLRKIFKRYLNFAKYEQNKFREISLSVHKIEKFKYFEK